MYTLFTTDFCPKCEYVKKLLNEKKIKYHTSQDKFLASQFGIKFVPCMIDEYGKKYTYPDILKLVNDTEE